MNEPISNESPAERKDFTPKSCLLIATIAAMVLIAGAFFTINRLRQVLPPELSRQSFDEAWDRWEATAPPDYRIEIDVVGPRSAIYAVDVKNHVVTASTHNGEPLPSDPRTMRTWSVPGMFDTMERDVMRIEKADAQGLSLRAEFDAKYGYPNKYYRNDHANKFEMRWTVKEFVVPTGAESAEPTESEN